MTPHIPPFLIIGYIVSSIVGVIVMLWLLRSVRIEERNKKATEDELR